MDKCASPTSALAARFVATRGIGAFSKDDQSCFAPEVKSGTPPTSAADIFGLGGILYQLLTGKSPSDGFVPPSQAHPDASAAIDQVLLMCLSADPAARFASPDEVRAALQPLVAGAPTASLADDLGVAEVVPSIPPPPSDSSGSDSFEVDISLASIAPAPSAQPLDPFAPAGR